MKYDERHFAPKKRPVYASPMPAEDRIDYYIRMLEVMGQNRQKDIDEATKPLHAEIERLHNEVREYREYSYRRSPWFHLKLLMGAIFRVRRTYDSD